jgi:hypothetical protein
MSGLVLFTSPGRPVKDPDAAAVWDRHLPDTPRFTLTFPGGRSPSVVPVVLGQQPVTFPKAAVSDLLMIFCCWVYEKKRGTE